MCPLLNVDQSQIPVLPESGIYPKSKDFQKNGGTRFSRVGFYLKLVGFSATEVGF